MEVRVKTITKDSEIQRIQYVIADSFDELQFMFPKRDDKAFGKIASLYRNFIIPKCPVAFPKMVLYHIPDEMRPLRIEGYGDICDDAALCSFLRKSIRVEKSHLVYKNVRAKEICEQLIEKGMLEIACGKRAKTKLLPVGNLGFLSDNQSDAKVKVNSHFFVMDYFDVASIYDKIGTPIGLMVKNGEIINPPLYDREAFLVYSDGTIKIRNLSLNELTFVINGCEFKDGENATLYERPKCCRIPRYKKGRFIVIVGCNVVGIYDSGGFTVPSSGYVLKITGDCDVKLGDFVKYKGLEDVIFGIQVGNSLVVNGKKTEKFVSKFYNIYRQFGNRAYPPSLYPLDYDNARAARMALGATREGKPCLIWAEGAPKKEYVKGIHSSGASLKEMADIAEGIGLYNAVNLDGGGSAQMLINNARELNISYRDPDDGSETERGIPVGIYL